MASVESLSDTELREKLLEYGYDLPISINKEFLRKKLKSVIQNANKAEANQPKRKSVGRTASVEKETLESRQLAAKAKTRFSLAFDSPARGAINEEPVDDGIEEDIPLPLPPIRNIELPSFIATTATPSFAVPSHSHTSTLDPPNDELEEKHSNRGGSVYGGKRKERYSNYLNLFRGSANEEEFRQSPLYSSRNFSEDESEEETPDDKSPTKLQKVGNILNFFSWKKKSTSPSPQQLQTVRQMEITKPADRPWLPTELSRRWKNGHTSGNFQTRGLSQRFDGRDTGTRTESPNISTILVFVLIMFFAVIGGCYYYKGRGVGEISETVEIEMDIPPLKYSKVKGGNYPICGMEGVDSLACIKGETVKHSRDLFTLLKEELVQRSKWKGCGADVEDKISLSGAKTLINRLSELTKVFADEAFRGMLFLCAENPKWGLRIENQNGDAILNYLEVDDLDVNTATIHAVDVEQFFICYVWMTVKSAINYLVVALIASVIAFAAVKLFFHYQKLKSNEERKMFQMVEEIVQVLYQHYEKTKETGEDPFLAVSHIRDELVPPMERQNKQALWNKVTDYISSNESRIREEMQHISGEEFKVWRWLPSASPLAAQRKSLSPTSLPAHLPNVSSNDSGNKWQGQAFEMSDGSPNALPPVTPTTCLKIRQMFDANINGIAKDVFEKIESTILEKCGDAYVTHIGIDPTSQEGCVYVKCATKEDARKAYMALHGWWFDGHLLSVKFLREERYFTRFPEVKNRTTRLTAPTKQPFGFSLGNNNMDTNSGPRYSVGAKKSF